ncbi:MAG: ABATE domain-containing protein [Solirubrobacterales bacterium]|nr:ABATE domain-containing protein [Solirubrobacterales bacterium]
MQTVQDMPFVAGNPALDFVNTAEERGHPDAGEALHGPAELVVWGQRYGLLSRSARLGPGAAREFKRALEARELLYELFSASLHQRRPRQASLTRLAELAAEAYRAAELKPSSGGVEWSWSRSELASVRHVAVTSAVQLLEAGGMARLKQCPGDHCGWFFLDATKRGNRRWCQMSECGQEAKGQRRRQRQQARRETAERR